MVDKKKEEENDYPTSVILDIRSIMEQMGLENTQWPEVLSPRRSKTKTPCD